MNFFKPSDSTRAWNCLFWNPIKSRTAMPKDAMMVFPAKHSCQPQPKGSEFALWLDCDLSLETNFLAVEVTWWIPLLQWTFVFEALPTNWRSKGRADDKMCVHTLEPGKWEISLVSKGDGEDSTVEELLFFHNNRNSYEFNGDFYWLIFLARPAQLFMSNWTAFKFWLLQLTLSRKD